MKDHKLYKNIAPYQMTINATRHLYFLVKGPKVNTQWDEMDRAGLQITTAHLPY
jgi:hypothetical protein